MFEQIFIILISAFIGYGIKYFWDKRFFLYKRKLRAIEKLKEAVGILAQGGMLYTQMQHLNFKKIETLDEIKKHQIQQLLDSLQTKQTIERLSNELKALNIQNNIQPYIPNDMWVILNAYRNLFTTAVLMLAHTPYCLDFIKKDNLKKSIIKDVIPAIPEMENFIKEDPIIRIFYNEELIRKKLLTAIENLNKKTYKQK